jgi:hypothetical protein
MLSDRHWSSMATRRPPGWISFHVKASASTRTTVGPTPTRQMRMQVSEFVARRSGRLGGVCCQPRLSRKPRDRDRSTLSVTVVRAADSQSSAIRFQDIDIHGNLDSIQMPLFLQQGLSIFPTRLVGYGRSSVVVDAWHLVIFTLFVIQGVSMVVAALQGLLLTARLRSHVLQHNSNQEIMRKLRSTLQFAVRVGIRPFAERATMAVDERLQGCSAAGAHTHMVVWGTRLHLAA